MAANTSWAALGKATDLRNRILFTIGLLIVYRLGTFIPVPGIDGAALKEFMEQAGQGIGGMVSMGMMGLFVGAVILGLAYRLMLIWTGGSPSIGEIADSIESGEPEPA